MKPAEVIALVDDQFSQIWKQFDIQLQRTAQLQLQLDRIHTKTSDACSTPDLVHVLVKKLVKAG